jgi:hypothetical protein
MASAVCCLLIAEEFPALRFMRPALDSDYSTVNYLVVESHARL